jgi:integrase
MARAIERLKPKQIPSIKAPGYYPDGGGLVLQVSESGAKSWIFRYQLKGKPHEMGLGSVRVRSLADARERALAASKLLSDGIDPIEARNAAEAAAALEAARSKTFNEVAKEYIDKHRSEWKNAKHIEQWETTIETYCAAILPLPIQGVDVGRILAVLEEVWSTKRETAVRLRGRIEKVLDYAKARGYCSGDNPARWRGNLKEMLPKDNRRERIEHHAALAYSQVGAFMKDLRAEEGTAARALEFTIMTAARTGETIGAASAELDLDGATWTIPAKRMKRHREHRVPLSPPAVELLRALPREGDYIFAGRKRGEALSNMAMLALLKRMGRGDLTVHGFRSSFRDWAAERTNFPNHVVEMALAHAIGDDVEAAYRRGDLFEKRRRLMNAWASYLSAPEASKVTPIRKAAA